MKKARKIFKIFSLTSALAFFIMFSIGISYYLISTKSASLNNTKLTAATNITNIEIFDINGNHIKPTTNNHISIKKLSSNTKNAFICAEDKRFYSHNGVDFIRIGGALISNLKTKSFSQGASTISQQLIKNTHLSNEKTIKRKLKEIKLTKLLEKKYSKADILEMYLNNIYFGNGCYGIENASLHYFGKSASKLSLSESAILAGTINAPSIYDIVNNNEKAIKRRNLILDLMYKYGKITNKEKEQAKSEKINLNLVNISEHNLITDQIIKEACTITKQSENQLKNQNLKIYTEIDLSLQDKISSIIKSKYKNLDSSPNIATIVINNKTNQIVSITGKKSTLTSKKQPGSTIKPILVYAPAIENNIISPATKILDEQININGYSPENADKKFHGYVSAREALKNSYNIPAVKLLQETGISTCQNFAKKLNIDFDKSDNHLAIALGGFKSGTTLKSLADAYSAFANGGKFNESSYITKIILNNKCIYKNQPQNKNTMTKDTAYLITNMLIDTAKTGTAKRLKINNYEVASKTGTVGNSKSNTDAFNISYTSNHTIISYIGETKMPTSINGATFPTLITKEILNILYENKSPKNFDKPDTVVVQNLDADEYQNNTISVTDKTENTIQEIFSKSNLPQATNSTLNLKLDVFNFEHKKPILSFFASPKYSYEIIRTHKNKEETISSLTNINDMQIFHFEDKSAKNGEIYEYYIKIYEKSSNNIFKTNKLKLKSF